MDGTLEEQDGQLAWREPRNNKKGGGCARLQMQTIEVGVGQTRPKTIDLPTVDTALE